MNKVEMIPQETPAQKKSRLVAQLGSLLHDEWRAPRKKEDGTFEPRIKKTKDKVWSEEHGTPEVDIANTDYANLPEDWKGENKISAEVAIDEIYKATENGQDLNDVFVEQASEVIHAKWLERNGSWAPAEQNKPYAELSEEEKEKDRAVIKKAIEIFNLQPQTVSQQADGDKLKEKKENAKEEIDAKSFNEIQGILKEVKATIERTFREPMDGRIDPEAAVMNYVRFKTRMFEISAEIKRAVSILEKAMGARANNFIANTGLGWTSGLTESSFEGKFGVKNVRGGEATEKSKEAWVNYCERFFAESKGLYDLFESSYKPGKSNE